LSFVSSPPDFKQFAKTNAFIDHTFHVLGGGRPRAPPGETRPPRLRTTALDIDIYSTFILDIDIYSTFILDIDIYSTFILDIDIYSTFILDIDIYSTFILDIY